MIIPALTNWAKHCYEMLFHYFAIYGACKIAVGFTEKT